MRSLYNWPATFFWLAVIVYILGGGYFDPGEFLEWMR